MPQDFSTARVPATTSLRAQPLAERDDANGYINGLLGPEDDDISAKTLDQSVADLFPVAVRQPNTIKSSLNTAARRAATLDSGPSQAMDGVHLMKIVRRFALDTSG